MRTVKQRWKALALAALVAAGLANPADVLAAASMKNVMCVKTNTGNYYALARVSMLVVPDGGSTFEIVVKDGEGEANVQSVSFEKHEEMIDLSLYQGNNPYGDKQIDFMKPVFIITSTGKYYKMSQLPEMTVEEGTNKIDLKVGSTTETGISAIYFYRGPEEGVTAVDAPTGGPAEEKLQLMTPIREQMTISGCGDAVRAQVYSLDGKMLAEAPVSNGVTTIQVGHLPTGAYVVRVGHKALKFTKK